MKSESSLVCDVWETVREHIAASHRVEVATAILQRLTEYGMERADLIDIVDEDKSLAAAFGAVFEEAEEEIGQDDYSWGEE